MIIRRSYLFLNYILRKLKGNIEINEKINYNFERKYDNIYTKVRVAEKIHISDLRVSEKNSLDFQTETCYCKNNIAKKNR